MFNANRHEEPTDQLAGESWRDCAHRLAVAYEREFDAHTVTLGRERAAVERAEAAEQEGEEQATVLTDSGAVIFTGRASDATLHALTHFRRTGEHARVLGANGVKLPGSRERGGTRRPRTGGSLTEPAAAQGPT